MTRPQNFEQIAGLVRERDRARYLTARFAPGDIRGDLLTLYAFNCELDRIPGLVSEAMLGEIRLQWWRDAIARPSGTGETGNPLADAVVSAIDRHDLPLPALQGMIDARSADLDDGGFQDWPAFRAYLYKSEGAIFALSAHVAGAAYKETLEAANAAAVAYGIAERLQKLPLDCAEGRVMLPLSMLHDAGVTPEQLLAGAQSEGMRDVVKETSEAARAALAESRALVASLPREARAVFAPLADVEPLLDILNAPGTRVLHEVSQINPLRQFLSIWRASRRGGF